MEHDVHALARCPANGQVTDITLDDLVLALAGVKQDVIEIAAIPRRKVVQTNDGLPQREERLEQVRANEAGDPGDEPCLGLDDQVVAKALV